MAVCKPIFTMDHYGSKSEFPEQFSKSLQYWILRNLPNCLYADTRFLTDR
jgi:hypothetical protein